MTKLITYREVDIYVTPTGTFYANPQTNSGEFTDCIIHSKTLDKVKKAVDECWKNKHSVVQYVTFDAFHGIPEIVNIVNQVGNLLVSDTGKGYPQHKMVKVSRLVTNNQFKALMLNAKLLKKMEDEYKTLKNQIDKLKLKIKNDYPSQLFLDKKVK